MPAINQLDNKVRFIILTQFIINDEIHEVSLTFPRKT